MATKKTMMEEHGINGRVVLGEDTTIIKIIKLVTIAVILFVIIFM